MMDFDSYLLNYNGLVMYANNAIYSLAENAKEKATYIPLLTLILIWPYIISSDILLNSVLNEVINEIIIIIIILV